MEVKFQLEPEGDVLAWWRSGEVAVRC